MKNIRTYENFLNNSESRSYKFMKAALGEIKREKFTIKSFEECDEIDSNITEQGYVIFDYVKPIKIYEGSEYEVIYCEFNDSMGWDYKMKQKLAKIYNYFVNKHKSVNIDLKLSEGESTGNWGYINYGLYDLNSDTTAPRFSFSVPVNIYKIFEKYAVGKLGATFNKKE